MFNSMQTWSWIVLRLSNRYQRKLSLRKRNHEERKNKHCEKKRAGSLFHCEIGNEDQNSPIAPLHWSARTPSMWHRYLNDQSGPEYTSQMNNSAREPQIDLTDMVLWCLLSNKRQRTPRGRCIRHPTTLQISGRWRAEVILPHAVTVQCILCNLEWVSFDLPLTGVWRTVKLLCRGGRHHDRLIVHLRANYFVHSSRWAMAELNAAFPPWCRKQGRVWLERWCFTFRRGVLISHEAQSPDRQTRKEKNTALTFLCVNIQVSGLPVRLCHSVFHVPRAGPGQKLVCLHYT